jgi:hypothetical protein
MCAIFQPDRKNEFSSAISEGNFIVKIVLYFSLIRQFSCQMSFPYIFAAQISDVHRTKSIKGTLHRIDKIFDREPKPCQYESVPFGFEIEGHCLLEFSVWLGWLKFWLDWLRLVSVADPRSGAFLTPESGIAFFWIPYLKPIFLRAL